MKTLRLLIILAAVGFFFSGTAVAEDLSTSGWRLWPDIKAPWAQDQVYLPEDVNLAKLPVNAPTGGWSTLNDRQGIPVNLPSTVEEHYWGKIGLRPYGQDYGLSQFDFQAKCGNYKGVSWWWRTFTPPPVKARQRLVLAFRAARLRAEVYVNGKLCSYSIFANLPFDADITHAVKAGKLNLLAVRITNPGGNFDWPESNVRMNNEELNGGRGFGGLDADIQMRIRDQVEVSDLAVLNKPNPREVTLLVEVKSTAGAYDGPVALAITRAGQSCWTGTIHVNVPAGGVVTARQEVSLPDAQLWELDNPVLYTASASLPAFQDGGAQRDFGFRWFTAEGIGSTPRLVLNGKRIVLRSAICWGYWGDNGEFPDLALAQKEVNAAKALGLNCLNFHREIGRTQVLDVQDQMGLLRYEEPGTSLGAVSAHNPPGMNPWLYYYKSTPNPIDTSGKGGEEPKSWFERYCTEKILAMMKRDRSHPSLIIYGLSNETAPNLVNPRIFALMRQMQELDPSRIILLKSGLTPQNQCFLLPYDPAFRYDNGKAYSGWYDRHEKFADGAWQDQDYLSPKDFTPLRTWPKFDPREIVVWGEAQISALPDNHALIVKNYREKQLGGYDRGDHEMILAGYDKFLDDYGFRSDFKTAGDLFQAIGFKGYFAFARIMEQMRMINKTDFIALNGWESTAIENHAGLVDVHRDFKGDPAVIKEACAPELLVLRPHHFVTEPGEQQVVDVFLINEVGRKGPHRLTLKAVAPDGSTLMEVNKYVTVAGGDVYGQLLAADLPFTAGVSGTIRLEATLTPKAGGDVLRRTQEIFSVPPRGLGDVKRIAVAGNLPWLAESIKANTGVAPVSLAQVTGPVDAIVLSYQNNWNVLRWGGGALGDIPGQGWLLMYDWAWTANGDGAGEEFTRYTGLAAGTCQVEIHFVEPKDGHSEEAAQRVFDVVLNGKTVLKGLNIAAATDHQRKVLIERFAVGAPDGVVSVAFKQMRKQSPPASATKLTDAALYLASLKEGEGRPVISAIKLTDASGKIIREYAGPEPWRDNTGATWQPLIRRTQALNDELAAALRQVHDHGARLVVLPDKRDGLFMMAAALGDVGVWKFNGAVGPSYAVWTGSWYFVRKHWLFDGLPTGCSLDWHYQVPASEDADGLLLTGKGLEVAVGYGRDHQAKVGMGACVAPWGKGQVVIFSLPGMARSLHGNPEGIASPVARRLLVNAMVGGR